jgi:hypothetical protein
MARDEDRFFTALVDWVGKARRPADHADIARRPHQLHRGRLSVAHDLEQPRARDIGRQLRLSVGRERRPNVVAWTAPSAGV